MRTAHKMYLSSLITAMVFGLSGPSLIFAHGAESHDEGKGSTNAQQDDNQAGTTTAANYVFVTPEGGSLSLIARRAIQLYDQENTSLALSQAQALYVESHLVAELGDRYLEIGEKITVSKDRLAAIAKESQALSATDLTGWQAYATDVDFNVAGINPEGLAAATPAGENPEKEKQKSDEAASSEEKKDEQQSARRESLPDWGVLAAIIAIGAAVYFLNPIRKPAPAPAKAKSKVKAKTSAKSPRRKK